MELVSPLLETVTLGAAAFTLIGSFVFLPGDTQLDHDAFAKTKPGPSGRDKRWS